MIFVKISQNLIKSPFKICLISQISVHSLWHVCLTCVDVFYLLIKMDFKLSQTNKGPGRTAKVVHSELPKLSACRPKRRFFSSIVNDVQKTLHCISMNFHLFYLNFYLIWKPLYLFGAFNVISEIGAEVIPFLAQMKTIIGAKVI